MWSDWLVFCNYGFSVSALWCPLTTPTVLFGFLLPWTWVISSRLLQQSAATAPYLGRGHPSWPWTWSSSSWPSCAPAATAPWMEYMLYCRPKTWQVQVYRLGAWYTYLPKMDALLQSQKCSRECISVLCFGSICCEHLFFPVVVIAEVQGWIFRSVLLRGRSCTYVVLPSIKAEAVWPWKQQQ